MKLVERFKKFDWKSLQHYLSPQAMDDLNIFLEKMPQTAGHGVLVAAGIIWGMAAAAGLFAVVQMQTLTELRAQLAETSALQPSVPQIHDIPVSQNEVKQFADDLAEIYPNLTVKQQGAAIFITAPTTAYFGQFREAIGHVRNGGTGWRISMEKMCVGRECKQNQLAALLKINKVSVEKPS